MNDAVARSFGCRRATSFAMAIPILVAGLCHSAVLGADPPVDSATSRGNLPKIVEREIAVEKLSGLLNDDWQPVKRDELRSLMDLAQPQRSGPKRTRIDRADYFAVLTDDKLAAGRLVYNVRQLAATPSLFVLSPVNLALTNLGWRDRRAVWGTMDDGRLAVRVDRRAGQLSGDWTLSGRRRRRRIEFAVQLPPATVSRMQLQIPAGWRLHSSAGRVTGPFPTPILGWAAWRVSLGSHSTFRLTARQPVDLPTTKPTVLVETDETHIIRRDVRQLQAKLSFDVSTVPLRTAIVRLPKSVNVLSVTYGRDLPLSFRVRQSSGRQTITIQFAEPIIGKSRPVTIQAIVTGQTSANPQLPVIQPVSGAFMGGLVHVRVEAPLAIQSLQTSGMRQISPVSPAQSGQTLSFKRWSSDATLKLKTAVPAPLLNALVVSAIERKGGDWQLRSQIDWTIRGGSRFSVEAALLPGWNVNEIRVGKRVGQRWESIESDWMLRRERGTLRKLIVDLPDSLRPGSPVSITIKATWAARRDLARFRLPILRPLRCERVTRYTAVHHPSLATSIAERFKNWRRLQINEIPKRVREMSPFSSTTAASDPPPTIFFAAVKSTAGVLKLAGNSSHYSARSWDVVETDGRKLRERITLTVKPTAGTVDRVLVFFPTEGRDTRWNQLAEHGGAITAVRLPKARHADWKLPESGELWQLSLSVATNQSFDVEVNRTATRRSGITVGLPFLPEAHEFSGVVEWTPPDSLDTKASVSGLIEVKDIQTVLVLRPESLGHKPPSARVWTYASIGDRLTLDASTGKPTKPVQSTAHLQLVSLLASSGGDDMHTATLLVDPHPAPPRLSFQLPATAILIDLRLNGDKLPYDMADGSYDVDHLPAARQNEIVIRYRLRSPPRGLRSFDKAPLPETSLTVIGFDWRFALPSRFRLIGTSSLEIVENDSDEASWRRQFFGPIGRPENEDVFNPLRRSAWTKLFERKPDPERIPAANQTSFAPQGWNVYYLSGLQHIGSTRIDIVDHVAVRRLAWVNLLACVTIGFLLRRRRIRKRVKIAAIWISCSIVATWIVTPAFAEIVGGGLIGTVIAALIPRRLIQHLRDTSVAKDISLGNTASYTQPVSSMTLTLLAAAVLIAGSTAARRTIAQVGPKRAPGETRQPAAPELLKPIDPATVIVPVAETKTGDASQSIVYVHKDLLQQLRAAAAHRMPTTRSLIRSARYQIKLGRTNSASVEATFMVDVLADDSVVAVELPFANVVLHGAQACKVNGRVSPVRRSRDGQSFVIDLHQAKRKARAPRRNSTARPAAPSPSGNESPVVAQRPSRKTNTFTITLELLAPIVGDDRDGRMAIRIPPVADSQLTLESTERLAFAQVSSNGMHTSHGGGDKPNFETKLGNAKSIAAAWSVNPRGGGSRATADLTVLETVEIQPAYSRHKFHLGYQPRSGWIESIVLNLPKGMIVRDVQVADKENGIDSFAVVPLNNRVSLLQIELTEPTQDPFTIEVSAIAPNESDRPRKNRSPTISLADLVSPDAGANDVRNPLFTLKSRRIAIRAVPEVGVVIAAPAMKDLTEIAPEDAVLFQRPFVGAMMPAKMFEVHRSVQVPYRLEKREPHRLVRQSQVGRFFRGYLEWEFTARVETTIASALVHKLIVDPRLNIDTISVLEDDAPRLVHWSRTGQVVTLFLSDKTAGTQSVALTGRLPIPNSTLTRLPAVHFADASTEDSSVSLFAEAGLNVQSKEFADFERIDFPAEMDGDTIEPFRAFRIPPEKSMPRVVVTQNLTRRSAETLTLISRTDHNHLLVATTLRFLPHLTATRTLQIQIPAELAAEYQIDPTALVENSAVQSDGSVIVIIRLPKPGPRTSTLQIVSTIREVTQRQWDVPYPTLLDGTIATRMVNLHEEVAADYQLTKSPSISEDDLPGWVRSALPHATETGLPTVYKIEKIPTLLHRKTASPRERGGRVVLMETRVSFDKDSNEVGRTTLLMTSLTKPEFGIHIPATVSLAAIRVNGSPVAMSLSDEGIAAVKLPTSRNTQVVVLYWHRPQDSAGGWLPFGSQHREYPRPMSLPIARSTLSILPPPHMKLFAISGISIVDAVRHQVERVDGLLEACEADEDLWHNRRPALWETTRKASRQLKALAKTPDQQDDASSREIAERIEKLDTRLAALQRSIAHLPVPDDRAAEYDREFAPSPSTESQLSEKPIFAVWPPGGDETAFSTRAVDRRWLTWPLAIIAIFVLKPFVRRFFRLETGELIAMWEPTAWALLGVVWWLCLTPSAVGVFLLAIAVFRAFKRRPCEVRAAETFYLSE